MKCRMTSSRYDPYELGYTRVTKVITKKDLIEKLNKYKNCFSSDYFLKTKNMKLKSSVIEN